MPYVSAYTWYTHGTWHIQQKTVKTTPIWQCQLYNCIYHVTSFCGHEKFTYHGVRREYQHLSFVFFYFSFFFLLSSFFRRCWFILSTASFSLATYPSDILAKAKSFYKAMLPGVTIPGRKIKRVCSHGYFMGYHLYQTLWYDKNICNTNFSVFHNQLITCWNLNSYVVHSKFW